MWGLWTLIVLLAPPILFSNLAEAKDAGVFGPTYPIAEEDAIDQIKHSLAKVDPEVIRKRLKDHFIEEGEVLLYVPQTSKATNRYIEPQAILSGDLKDAEGKVLFPKGHLYNPIEKMIGKRVYLVADGTDPRQIAWIKDALKESPAKILITKGNVFTLASQLKTMVYPAKKEILEALQVSSIPTKVTQEGKILHVEAMVP
jgi:conjugal transfer pilus assembly protein TraW